MLANNKNNVKRILLTGGGTGGSVAPLLAVAEELQTSPQPSPYQGEGVKIPLTPFDKGGKYNPPNPSFGGTRDMLYQGGKNAFEFLWLGTKFGPEREMVERAGIKFKAIAGGKWRRYFSLKNLADIFKIKLGFWQAFFIMLKWRPNLVISAGSFISVPVVWAAWLLRVPVLIHQQDVVAGLANKLMAPFAKVVTVAFESSLKDYGKKAVWIGNPVRSKKLEVRSKNYFNLNVNLPVVLIVGGGTGAEAINRLVENSLAELTKFCQVIHVTGKDKSKKSEVRSKNYESYEFLDADQMAEALQAADLAVTRAGMGFLTELSFLSKPSIIIPMPESHQVANAEFFRNKKAAMVIGQKDLTVASFTHIIKDLLADETRLGQLAVNMSKAMKRGAGREMVKIILRLLS